ncbi:hypothetical protein [Coraliomargarita akajimensis]|uniref:Uncharacterized protein n=1 Tax=Coraliomargarita akajimensis (strain DSM 45221 / IAM 15411 / JCM 23193 / KCTC 12865 / 04OKA010-24) TaxID=583355 RepID=D5EMQ5_CORAD|nr:hypothetical protein [Coraliomargarita akajimensis]ADE55295.1 hypothetical protein Caka_2278 [Coraliomargarita akajimensis DSM 45221]
MSRLIEILKKFPLAVGASVLALLCVGVYMLRGGAVEAGEIEKEQMEARLRVIKANKKNAAGLEADTEGMEAIKTQIDERLFDRSKVAINTEFFYTLGEDVGVEIENVGQLPEPPQILAKGGVNELKEYSSIVYNLTVIGTNKELMSFLIRLHALDAVCRASNFRVSESGGADEPALQMMVQVFVLAEKEG